MTNTSITISFDEEKLSALKMYLSQRGVQVESELERSLETLYTKTVPAGVREFIEMKSGNTPKPAPPEFIEMKSGNTPKPAPPVKKPKPSPSSAVGAGGQEVQNG